MSKRKLTLQQKRRIAAKQQRSADKKTLVLDDSSLEPEQAGIIITRFAKQADVLPPDFAGGDIPKRCHIRANITSLVTGDLVDWRQGDSGCVVERVKPRQSCLSRPDSRGVLRPVASNVDLIAIVIAIEPTPHNNLIDRYLVAAENQDITPCLIINKMDLPSQGSFEPDACAAKYQALGYRVHRVSATTGQGMASLKAALAQHTTVLVGQSGVGKSSLINHLHPQAQAATGNLSEQVAKGRHTTTSATFYRLAQGGNLIDSPGIREFGLWHLAPQDVAYGFAEFKPYLGTCQFRDCQHTKEPGCAIVQACENGKISHERLQSYQHIIQEQAS